MAAGVGEAGYAGRDVHMTGPEFDKAYAYLIYDRGLDQRTVDEVLAYPHLTELLTEYGNNRRGAGGDEMASVVSGP